MGNVQYIKAFLTEHVSTFQRDLNEIRRLVEADNHKLLFHRRVMGEEREATHPLDAARAAHANDDEGMVGVCFGGKLFFLAPVAVKNLVKARERLKLRGPGTP
jgi:hypothetical protein